MAVKEIKVMVSERGYNLGEGLKNFILAIKQSQDDGWQPGQDLPAILSAAIADLVPVLPNIQEIANEPSEDLEAFVTGLMIPVKEIGFIWYKK